MNGRAGGEGGGRMRYEALDGYRFLAAAAIVAFHYNYDFHLGLSGASRAFDKLYVYVDFFFVLSGFVIAASHGDRIRGLGAYGGFLLRRLARVYPLHLLTLAALVASVEACAALGWFGERPGIWDRSALPQTVLLLHAWGTTHDQAWNLPSWSISAEWFAYLLYPALAWIAARLPLAGTIALAAAYVAAVQWARTRLGLYDLTNATSDGAMRVVPAFLVGVALAKAVASWGGRIPRVPHAAAHALFLAPLALLHLGAPDLLAILPFPAAVLCSALAERAAGPGAMGSRGMARLGQASYALYMVHFPVALLALHGIVRAEWLEGPWRWAGAGATALASVGLALACHGRFEVPAQRWVLSLGRRTGAGAAQARA